MSQTLSVEREREWLVLLSIWRGENVNTDGVSEKKDNSLNPGSVAVHASCGARLLLPYRLFLRSIDRSRRCLPSHQHWPPSCATQQNYYQPIEPSRMSYTL